MSRIKDPDRHGFFDGDSADGKPDPGAELEIRLRRVVEPKQPRYPRLARLVPGWLKSMPTEELFILEQRIGYQARGFEEPHRVPADDTFRTDLTSVPDLFTWLVPRTGCHLPAALLHDGLVHEPNSPVSYLGPSVTRAEADRIFREAMADLGTGWVRRWLMWAAVTLPTVWAGFATKTRDAASGKGPDAKEAIQNWYYRIVVFGSLLAIGVIGTVATLDLFDRWNVLPWMDERSTGTEILYGAAGAVVIPALLSILWYRLVLAGLIAGWALAGLLHVTVVLAVLTGVFQVFEFLARLRRRRSTVQPVAPAALIIGGS